jgi:hypothetical protein
MIPAAGASQFEFLDALTGPRSTGHVPLDSLRPSTIYSRATEMYPVQKDLIFAFDDADDLPFARMEVRRSTQLDTSGYFAFCRLWENEFFNQLFTDLF